MSHVALLGDSMFDNASYVSDRFSVIELLKKTLPQDWEATLLAVDGSVSVDVLKQLPRLAPDTSHIVISCGGNDALQASGIVQESVETIDEALCRLADMREEFSQQYRQVLTLARQACAQVSVCTIYDAIPDLSRVLRTALALFNEVILREASIAQIPVIDLRVICDVPADYSSIS